MGKTLYLECYGGISGGRAVTALLDLGADKGAVKRALLSLTAGKDGASPGSGIKKAEERIKNADMAERAKETSVRMLGILEEAGCEIKERHIREIGAAAVCLDSLDITKGAVSELWEGKGRKKTISGYEPIPLPPVSRILCTYGMSLHLTEEERPLITPVGAAIAAVVRTMETPETFSIKRTGVGDCGEDFPGPVRAMLIEPKVSEKGEQERDTILKLETNVDDCTGEALGFVMEKLFFAGARDVHYTPVFMKKNRPGWLLTVLCTEDKAQELEEILFRETTTIGIRRTRMERRVLKREQRRVETPLGEILVKVCTLEGKERWYPEYESLAKICRETGISYQEALHMAEEACLKAGQKEAGKF